MIICQLRLEWKESDPIRWFDRIRHVQHSTGMLKDWFQKMPDSFKVPDSAMSLDECHRALVELHSEISQAEVDLHLTLARGLEESLKTLDGVLADRDALRAHKDFKLEIRRMIGTLERKKKFIAIILSRVEMQQKVVSTVLLDREEHRKLTLQQLYHIMRQRDNAISLALVAESRRIAKSARDDSSTMKKLTAITVLFLPLQAIAVNARQLKAEL